MRYTLNDLYEDYVLNCEGNPADYEEWLDNVFAKIISDLPYYVQCVLYNEIAETKGWCQWSAIEDLYNIPLKEIYPKINHDHFCFYDDVYVIEYNKIVSYSYPDFLETYSDPAVLTDYIHLIGLENLKCYDLLAIRVV